MIRHVSSKRKETGAAYHKVTTLSDNVVHNTNLRPSRVVEDGPGLRHSYESSECATACQHKCSRLLPN